MIWCFETYIIAYVKTHKKNIRFIIHYVKPTAQLFFLNLISKRWTNMQEASG